MGDEQVGRTGGTIVLVHGAWHGSWCWEHWIGPLTDAGYDVRTIDLPGHDVPGRRRRFWTPLSAYVAALDAFVAELGDEVTVVGHSMGGLVVQRFLERRTVRRAVLLASVPRRGAIGVTLRQLRHQPATTLRAIVTLDLWPLVCSPERTRRLFFSGSSSAEVVDRTAAHVQNESYLAYLSMLVRWPKPSKVATPVSVVAAEADAVFTLAEQRSLAAAYRTDLVVLAGLGHDAMLDEPGASASAVVAALAAAR